MFKKDKTMRILHEHARDFALGNVELVEGCDADDFAEDVVRFIVSTSAEAADIIKEMVATE